MDKNTLSNYGWIVIAVLVLSVMIALATPFGKYVESGVRSTTAGLFETSEKALNVVGMSAKTEQYYYDSLYDAVNALNNNDFTNASEDNTKNIVIIKGQGKFTIQLQRNIVEIEIVDVSTDCIIDLNNFSIEMDGTININDVKCTVKNGFINKKINNVDQRATILNVVDNASLTMNSVNCDLKNNVFKTSAIINLKTETNASLTMNDCKLVSTGNDNQNDAENGTKTLYNIYSKSYGNITLNNCENFVSGLYIYNIFAKNSTVNINSGYYENTSTAMGIRPEMPEEALWASNGFFFYNTTAIVNNITLNSVCNYRNHQMNICLQGNSTLDLRNSKLYTIGNHNQYAYTVSLQGNQTENIPYAYIENCELINEITANSRALHISGQSTVDCVNSKLFSNKIAVFLNDAPKNICNIKNSYIEAPYGVYKRSAANIYTEEDIIYNVSQRIFY